MTEAKQKETLRYFRHKIAESGRRTSLSGTILRVAKEAIDDATLTPKEYLESRLDCGHDSTQDAALRLICTMEQYE